ncbi:sulfatase-like hydrolase/transferase [Stieleria sp. TO1_6]|uniref:sulfatase-like hydrolase/transferase n=1 Tax=Stieleria tagensis TaxID=2956795 RepID=UPI00209BAAC9|nr:sulfatase-like hydrolase/transferase [Stieleria tagensis]MCO8124587.1 sulfatase-like hydrolase/transferase [Stieleria tagensis]
MKYVVCWLVAGWMLCGAVAAAESAEPIPIIFDTDIDTDCDDVGAVACLHAMADRDEVEILATTVSSNFAYSAPCLDALNRFYGRPNLPLGVPKREGASVNRGSRYAQQIAKLYPSRFATNADAPSAVTVLRRALAKARDHSVRLVTVGYLTNIADLLRSPGDQISPLTGQELAAQKVDRFVVMGGRYPEHLDPGKFGNFKPDPDSIVYVAEHWPGAIYFSGQGEKIGTGKRRGELPADHPLRVAYDLFLGEKPTRSSWDQVALLFAVRPDADYWTVREQGGNQIFANGTNRWVDQDPGDHRMFEYGETQRERVASIIEGLMMAGATDDKPKESPGLKLNTGSVHPQRPNIVFLLADDLGYGDLACYGRTDIKTPQLDQLARDGVRFTAHYANGAECTPTRTAFLTGRYQQRVGGLECAIGTGNVGRYDDAIRLAERSDLGLPAETQTIAKLLQQSGYATAITGKWHLGYEPKFAPHLQGFDHAFYCIGGGMDYFYYLDNLAGYNLFENGNPVHRDGYFTDLLTDEAIAFVKRQTQQQPFFLYVPYTCPHSPYQGPGDDLGDPLPLDSDRWSQSNADPGVYVAMIEHMDRRIGDLLTALQQQQLADNTLVIFASDNGGTRSARNAPYSGYKGSTYEGGIRVPAIMRMPGVIPAGTESSQPCITFDFTQSIARLAGVSAAAEKPFEGIDLVEHVASGREEVSRKLYWRKPRGETIWKGMRDGDLKLVAERKGDTEKWLLFDLANDPAEQRDLKGSWVQDFQRLRASYQQWETEVRRGRRGSE